MSKHLNTAGSSLRFMRGNVLVLTITGAIGMFSRLMAFPYASLFLRELGGSPSDIGLVNSLAPIAGLVLFPIAGYICDRSGRVNLIVLSFLIAASTTLLYVFSPNWQVYALASILRGTTMLQFPPSSAILADSLAPENRGKGLALMSTLSSIPAMFSPYIAGYVIERFGVNLGVRGLFAWLFVATLASALICKRYLRETASGEERKLTAKELLGVLGKTYRGIPELLRSVPAAVRAHLAMMILVYVASCVASPFWVLYAVDHIGLGAEQWGVILLIESIIKIVAYPITGELVDRCGRRRCILIGLAVATVAAPCFVLATGFWSALICRIVTGIASALFMPASSAMMADRVPREQRGRVMAAMGRGSAPLAPAAGGTGGPGTGYLITVPLMVSSFCAGYLYELHPTAPWVVTGIALAGALALTTLFIRDTETAEA